MEHIEIKLVDNMVSLARCLKIRNIVFVLEKKVPEEIEVDGHDCLNGICDHFLIQYNNIDIGTIRCMHMSENTIRVQRFCFLKEYRRLGFGKTVMGYIENYYNKQNIMTIEMDAKYEVYGFYEKCGYKRVSDVFIEAGVEHVKMWKETK